jgi:hypothetical protein
MQGCLRAECSNPSIERTFQRPLRALAPPLMSNLRRHSIPTHTLFAYLLPGDGARLNRNG